MSDYQLIREILQSALGDNRTSLFEHEVYRVLQAAGCSVPRFLFLPDTRPPRPEDVSALGSNQVVVKVVSPLIVHKSDTQGVTIVRAQVDAVQAAIDEMLREVPSRFLSWVQRQTASGPASQLDERAVRASIRGFLLVERVNLEGRAPGNELLLSLRYNREFGPVLTFGVGGVDTELLNDLCHTGTASVFGSPALLDELAWTRILPSTLAYQRVTGATRGQPRLLAPEKLIEVARIFHSLAKKLGSPGLPGEPFVTELEVNPFAIAGKRLVALDGLLRFAPSPPTPPLRPRTSVRSLLHPRSLAIVGVSAKTDNVGHIILRNVLEAGFHPEHIWVVHPDAQRIDGVRCVPDIGRLPSRVDVCVVTVPASQAPTVIEQLVHHDRAVGVVLISGGFAEKVGGLAFEDRIKTAIAAARAQGLPLVVNGGNSLGVVSAPGHYHTLFIPQNKLPLPVGNPGGTAFLSQSGAYMISRLSKLPWLRPRYAISTGNQIDLTVADYLDELADAPDIHTFAVYVEGFREGDGLAFAQAVQHAAQRGRDVVFYKAGRTPEGKSAASSHTASIAGDYDVCESIVSEAGGLVARTFTEFLHLLSLSSLLVKKAWGGMRLAAMSNAGYEAVGVADSLRNSRTGLELADLQAPTRAVLQETLRAARLDRLVDVRNPLDVTPMADDAVHESVVQALLGDPGVDIVLCASVPLTPAVASLSSGVPEAQSIRGTGSLVNRLSRLAAESAKPLVACVDGGPLFDPMASALEIRGIPAFRSVDDAVHAVSRYATYRRHHLRRATGGGPGAP